MIKQTLMISLGGAIGSASRYFVGLLVKRYFSLQFPMGTFIVNIMGCLLIGLLIGFFAKSEDSRDGLQLLWITGFCGGFTTFSSFAAESIDLIKNDQIGLALLYIGGSIVLGLLTVWIGIALTRI